MGNYLHITVEYFFSNAQNSHILKFINITRAKAI